MTIKRGVKTVRLRRKKMEEAKLVNIKIKLPTYFIKIFDKHIKGADYISLSDYIRYLIRKDLRERGLLE